MTGLINALEFLTILRFRKAPSTDTGGLSSSWIYFPLVGAFLGLALIILDRILSPFIPALLLSFILVFTLVILSGAMHIDGLADSCDALFSGKKKEEMLSIMRDPHKGTFGVLGITADILFKALLLSSIPSHLRLACLLLMGVLSRYGMCIAIAFFPYARNDGKAKVFFGKKSLKDFLFSTLITLILLTFTLSLITLIALICVVILTFLVSSYLNRKIAGLTGDSLGALSELNELAVLLSVFILARVNL